jgi:hypothetical protein
MVANRFCGATVLLVITLLMMNAEVSMARGRNETLFSEFSGRLVNGDGIAQTGVRIVRSWKMTPEDAPSVDENGELAGRPLVLECRIDMEPNGEGPAWGTCRETGRNGELALMWQWPAGRAIEHKMLVRLERLDVERRGFPGVRNSPSLAGSLPDPHILTGTVVHGPVEWRGSLITLRLPGTEVAGLTTGGMVAIALLDDGRVCVCIAPAPEGTSAEQSLWLAGWSCE